MNRVLTLFAVLCIIIGLSDHASGSSFRCDGKLISVGVSKYEVLSKCGEPTFSNTRYERRIKRDFYRDLFRSREIDRREPELYREPLFVEEEVVIEEWTYNLGPRSFIRYLIFENGRLVDILTGDYGF